MTAMAIEITTKETTITMEIITVGTMGTILILTILPRMILTLPLTKCSQITADSLDLVEEENS